MSDRCSLWTAQEALKALSQLGLVDTQTVGRAGVHTINEGHIFGAPLRALLDPIAALTATVREAVGDQVQTVILFGSIARGEATPVSDIEDAVRTRLGNACDVVVFGPEELIRLASADEPVVGEILTDGVALVGSMPRMRSGAP